jgi:hypothetical protein
VSTHQSRYCAVGFHQRRVKMATPIRCSNFAQAALAAYATELVAGANNTASHIGVRSCLLPPRHRRTQAPLASHLSAGPRVPDSAQPPRSSG